MNKFFTEKEIDCLQLFRKKGGIFLRIHANEDHVEILVSDGNLGYKHYQDLDGYLARTVKDAYANQTEYHAPLVNGVYDVSLAWFIVKFSDGQV